MSSEEESRSEAKENIDPCFSFLSKEDELDLQKAFVQSNTQRSTSSTNYEQ